MLPGIEPRLTPAAVESRRTDGRLRGWPVSIPVDRVVAVDVVCFRDMFILAPLAAKPRRGVRSQYVHWFEATAVIFLGLFLLA